MRDRGLAAVGAGDELDAVTLSWFARRMLRFDRLVRRLGTATGLLLLLFAAFTLKRRSGAGGGRPASSLARLASSADSRGVA